MRLFDPRPKLPTVARYSSENAQAVSISLIQHANIMSVTSFEVTGQRINTFTASNPVKLFTVVAFGKGGIGGGCGDGDPDTMPGTGDLGLGIISFLLPGGINSGGSTLGIAYFSNALYTRCMACTINKENRWRSRVI